MADSLMEEIVEEILLRLPPDDPASLLRAATVCRRWCRVISTPSFRRRFGERHRTAPMLGFLANTIDVNGDLTCYFVPATSFARLAPRAKFFDERAVDARHGRVLLTYLVPWQINLEVWDPVTGDLRILPPLPAVPSALSPNWDGCKWNAAVVCAAHGACNHLDCGRGPFLVVFLDASAAKKMSVQVYSSEADAWSDPTYGPPPPEFGAVESPATLVRHALYFLIDKNRSILEYDLATRNMSVIHLPLLPSHITCALMTEEDGGLGFASLEDSTLRLWSMETCPDGGVVWAQTASIELETLLRVDASSIKSYVDFAHGIGVIFVGTGDGSFTIDLKSSQVRKVEWELEWEYEEFETFGVVPFTSFYTPDLHQYGIDPVGSE